LENSYIFPRKCCACLSDCSTERKLIASTSMKDGFYTKVTTFSCSVPVCEKCQDKFKKTNYGLKTWFASILIGAVLGASMALNGAEGDIGSGAALGALGFAIIGSFPSIYISLKYDHITEPPAYLSKIDGKPCFLNKEYQQLFEELNFFNSKHRQTCL
jgi:hypothetical protein